MDRWKEESAVEKHNLDDYAFGGFRDASLVGGFVAL
jgi:hypothetical protein